MLHNMLHNIIYSRLIFQYNQEYNKTNLLHNIKYTQSEHNTYTLKFIQSKVHNNLYSWKNFAILPPYVI